MSERDAVKIINNNADNNNIGITRVKRPNIIQSSRDIVLIYTTNIIIYAVHPSNFYYMILYK